MPAWRSTGWLLNDAMIVVEIMVCLVIMNILLV